MSRTHRGCTESLWTSADFVRGRSRSVDNASRWVRTCGQVRQQPLGAVVSRVGRSPRRPIETVTHASARQGPGQAFADALLGALTHEMQRPRELAQECVSVVGLGPTGRPGGGGSRVGVAAGWRGSAVAGRACQRGGGAARWGWQRGGGAARWGWQRPGGRASSAGAHPGGPQQRPLACQHPGPARARRPGGRSAQGNPDPRTPSGPSSRVFGGCDSGPPGRSGLGPTGTSSPLASGRSRSAARRPTSADHPYVTLRGEAAQADSCSVKRRCQPAGTPTPGRARPRAVELSTAAISSSPSQKCRAFSTADATVGTMPSSRNAGMKQTINGSTLRTPTRRAASST